MRGVPERAIKSVANSVTNPKTITRLALQFVLEWGLFALRSSTRQQAENAFSFRKSNLGNLIETGQGITEVQSREPSMFGFATDIESVNYFSLALWLVHSREIRRRFNRQWTGRSAWFLYKFLQKSANGDRSFYATTTRRSGRTLRFKRNPY